MADTHQGAVNQGSREANQNLPCSPQGHNEPSTLFQTRQATYDWTKKQNGN